MPDSLEVRLGRIEDNQTKLLVEVAKITEKLKELNGDVAAVVAEVGGAPKAAIRGDRETIRLRVHRLENDQNAAAAAHAALDAAKAANAQAWSRFQKIGIFAFAAVAAVSALLRLIGVGG